jgi:hypothetical protein
VHTPEAYQIDLITVYGKDETDDLSGNEIKELCELAHLLREEATKRARRRTPRKKSE